MKPQRAPERVTSSIAVCAFLVGLATALWSGSFFGPTGEDTRNYRVLALNVIHGHGLSLSERAPYQPSADRAPVYPIFLAAIYSVAGESPEAVFFAQSMVLGFAWVLLADIAAMLFDRRVALLTALSASLNPYLGRVAGSLLTEALFTVLIVATIWALIRGFFTGSRRWFAACGVLWGVATLCRPATVLALPLTAVAIWLWSPRLERRAASVAVLVVSGLLTLAPWTVRNYLDFKAFIPLQTRAFGFNFWLTTLDHDEQPLVTWDGKREQWMANHPELHAWFDARNSLEQEAAERLLVKAGIERIRSDPWRYTRNHLRVIPHLWLHSGKVWFSDVSFGDALTTRRYGAVVAKAALLITLSLIPLTLAAVGLWLARHRWRQMLPLLIVAVAIAAAYLPSWIEERYGLPAVPFFLVLAASAVIVLWDRVGMSRSLPYAA